MKTQQALWSNVDTAPPQDAAIARHWPLLILLLLLPIWSVGVFNRDIWTPDEPREYDIGYNMLQSGDLITPRLAGEPFLEKPPLSYWAQSASMWVLGPSSAAARVPNLVWAALAVLCIGLLASNMASERNRDQAAFIASLVCGTMFLLQQTQIWLATDAPLIAMTAASLLSAWRLAHAEHGRQQFTWSLLLGLSLSAAFLTKNGFGLLVPGLTVLGWMLWERRLSQLLHWRWWAAAAWLGLFAGAWLIALYRRPGGSELLHTLLWENLAGRFLSVQTSTGLGHESSHWGFLLLIPVYVIPWTAAMLATARWSVASARRATELTSAVRFCLASVVLSCTVLLISHTARGVYFAPALLCLPVLLSLWLTSRSAELTRFEQLMLSLTRRTLQILAVLFAAVTGLVVALNGIRALPVSATLLAAALVMLLLIGGRLSQRVSPRVISGVVGATGIFLASLVTFEVLAFPTIDRVQDLRTVVAAAEPQLKNKRVVIYCGDETIRATLDHAIDLRLPDICGTDAAERLLRDHSDQKFLVLLAPPRSTQRLIELFPNLDWSHWKTKEPRSVQRLVDLKGLGLQPEAQWSVPGGRKYALYGRSLAEAAPVESAPTHR